MPSRAHQNQSKWNYWRQITRTMPLFRLLLLTMMIHWIRPMKQDQLYHGQHNRVQRVSISPFLTHKFNTKWYRLHVACVNCVQVCTVIHRVVDKHGYWLCQHYKCKMLMFFPCSSFIQPKMVWPTVKRNHIFMQTSITNVMLLHRGHYACANVRAKQLIRNQWTMETAATTTTQ